MKLILESVSDTNTRRLGEVGIAVNYRMVGLSVPQMSAGGHRFFESFPAMVCVLGVN